MNIPDGYTENEILQILDDVVAPLAELMKFGHYDTDDMIQEGKLFAISALGKFDPENDRKCSLENFLRIHVRNRFINLRRDKLYRTQSPCLSCQENDNCPHYQKLDDCPKYAAWFKRNNAKRSLMEGNQLVDNKCYEERDVFEKIYASEFYNFVLDNISMEFRGDLLRLINDVYIPKKKRDILIIELKNMQEIFDGEKKDGESVPN